MHYSKTKSVVLEKTKHLLELKYSGRTPSNYLHHIALFLDHAKNVPGRVTNEDIINYNISIRNKGHSYRNVAINAIKAYFKLYLRKKVKGFASIRPPEVYKQPKVYNAEILAIKINNIQNLKHKAILTLGLSAWLRQGELRNLLISNIDSTRMVINIINGKGQKDREVKLSTNTLTVLRNYFKVFKPKKYLFNGQKTEQYNSINAVCQNYLGIRFHALRATGSTFALASGTDIKTVSEMLGHKKIETTKFYIPTLLNRVHQAL